MVLAGCQDGNLVTFLYISHQSAWFLKNILVELKVENYAIQLRLGYNIRMCGLNFHGIILFYLRLK